MGESHFYVGQFLIAAIRIGFPLRVFLKETRDVHVLMTVGRAFHIFLVHGIGAKRIKSLVCAESGLIMYWSRVLK